MRKQLNQKKFPTLSCELTMKVFCVLYSWRFVSFCRSSFPRQVAVSPFSRRRSLGPPLAGCPVQRNPRKPDFDLESRSYGVGQRFSGVREGPKMMVGGRLGGWKIAGYCWKMAPRFGHCGRMHKRSDMQAGKIFLLFLFLFLLSCPRSSIFSYSSLFHFNFAF